MNRAPPFLLLSQLASLALSRGASFDGTLSDLGRRQLGCLFNLVFPVADCLQKGRIGDDVR